MAGVLPAVGILAALFSPEADAIVAKAEVLFAEGRFEEALVELEVAEGLEARPDILFMQGRCLRYLDRCAEAIPKYKAFLETEPNDKAIAATHADLEKCGAQAEEEPPPSVEPPPPRPGSTPPTKVKRQPVTTDEPSTPPARDTTSFALIGAGAGVAAVGVGLGVAGGVTVQRSSGKQDIGAYDDAVRRGQIVGGVGWSLAGIGATLITAGLIRFALRRRAGGSR